jgi:hypothetical protein
MRIDRFPFRRGGGGGGGGGGEWGSPFSENRNVLLSLLRERRRETGREGDGEGGREGTHEWPRGGADCVLIVHLALSTLQTGVGVRGGWGVQ